MNHLCEENCSLNAVKLRSLFGKSLGKLICGNIFTIVYIIELTAFCVYSHTSLSLYFKEIFVLNITKFSPLEN